MGPDTTVPQPDPMIFYPLEIGNISKSSGILRASPLGKGGWRGIVLLQPGFIENFRKLRLNA